MIASTKGTEQNKMMGTLNRIREATLSLRQRTNCKEYGTAVKAGKLKLVKVTYDSKGVSTVIDVLPFMSIDALIEKMSKLVK